MADFFKLMQQARDMQGKMQEIQEELGKRIYTGSAGGGMVTVRCDGTGKIKGVKLEPTVVNPADIEMLEDLIGVAAADAQQKAATGAQAEMSKLTGGIELPFKLPF